MIDHFALTIKAIYDQEPMREGEYPANAQVGCGGVTKIECREDNMGDHGILWFDLFKGETQAMSFGGRHVSLIVYED